MPDTQNPLEQTIAYRGGVVMFELPERWVAEYGDEGGGVFWDPGVEGGTLRLDLLTLDKDGALPPKPALAALQALGGEGDIRELGDNAIKEHAAFAEEDGNRLKIHYWEIANFVPPNHFRLAIFSYTMLADDEDSAAQRDELKWLSANMTAVRFSEELGDFG